jgi:hypothetical protein
MLRYGFLPSDFHPMILFLGEAEDLRRFAALMHGFSQERRDIAFETVAFMHAAQTTRVLLTTAGAEPGMRAVPAVVPSFIWTLEPGRPSCSPPCWPMSPGPNADRVPSFSRRLQARFPSRSRSANTLTIS